MRYLNTSPRGEPQLGKRGIYRTIGGSIPEESLVNLLWVLNFSDGDHSLLDIAERSAISFREIRQAADLLQRHDLLALCPEFPPSYGKSQHERNPPRQRRLDGL